MWTEECPNWACHSHHKADVAGPFVLALGAFYTGSPSRRATSSCSLVDVDKICYVDHLDWTTTAGDIAHGRHHQIVMGAVVKFDGFVDDFVNSPMILVCLCASCPTVSL